MSGTEKKKISFSSIIKKGLFVASAVLAFLQTEEANNLMEKSEQQKLEEARENIVATTENLENMHEMNEKRLLELSLMTIESASKESENNLQWQEELLYMADGIYLSEYDEKATYELIESGKKEELYSFYIKSSKEKHKVALWVQTEELGYSDEIRMYCYDGSGYREILYFLEGDVINEPTTPVYYTIQNYKAFPITVGEGDNEKYSVMIKRES